MDVLDGLDVHILGQGRSCDGIQGFTCRIGDQMKVKKLFRIFDHDRCAERVDERGRIAGAGRSTGLFQQQRVLYPTDRTM